MARQEGGQYDHVIRSKDAHPVMETGENVYLGDGQKGNAYLKFNREDAMQREAVMRRVGKHDRNPM